MGVLNKNDDLRLTGRSIEFVKSNIGDNIIICSNCGTIDLHYNQHFCTFCQKKIEAEDKEADTFFPEFNKKEWKKKVLTRSVQNNIPFKMCVYERKIM